MFLLIHLLFFFSTLDPPKAKLNSTLGKDSVLINATDAYFISKVEGVTLIGGRCLNKEGAYFKVRGFIPMKFKNFIIFSILIIINNYHYDIYVVFDIPELPFVFSFRCLLICFINILT